MWKNMIMLILLKLKKKPNLAIKFWFDVEKEEKQKPMIMEPG